MDNRNIEIGGKTYQKHQVIMLPSQQSKGGIVKNKDGNLYTNIANIHLGQGHQHLYFISDESPEDGDWFYNFHGQINQNTKKFRIKNAKFFTMPSYFKKIISSTDELFIDKNAKDGLEHEGWLPRPSNEFIQAYCKNKGQIKEVLIEMECTNLDVVSHGFTKSKYAIKVNPDNTITIKKVEEKMYNEHDMFLNMQYYMEHCQRNGYCTPQDWIENHKHF